MKKAIYLLFIVVAISSCNNKGSFTVKGTIEDAKGKTLYFESLGMDKVTMLDSVQLGSSGDFKFKRKASEYPEFYRLRLDNQNIDIAVDSTDNITIEANTKDFSSNYFIDGSFSSKKMKLISLACQALTDELNTIQQKVRDSKLSSDSAAVTIDRTVTSYKKQLNSLVFEDTKSPYAYYTIFQRIKGYPLYSLTDKDDLKIISAVATAYNFYMPESPRTKQLYNMALEAINMSRKANRQIVLDESKISSNIEIELPDIKGNTHTLSSLQGKVVLLNFTAYETDFSPALNIQLANMYRKYASQGFEIFQVSLDPNEHQWKVSASNLPWLCVRDEQSTRSRYMTLYNVTELPTLFILDRKGTVSSRVKSLGSLEGEIKKYL